jgi:LPXTG-site transpeptidase (sortase) family protein
VRTGPDSHGRGKGLPWVLAALGVLLVLAGGFMLLRHGGGGSTKADVHAAPARPAQVARARVHGAGAQTTHEPRPSGAGRPLRLAAPSLAVSAPVTPIELEGTALVPPSDPQVLGWWRDGSLPGAARGTAVITGHTVHTGGGSFDHLRALRPGDPISIRTTRGVLDYRVTTVRNYSKAQLTDHARSIFSRTVPGRLALITCTDWNGVDYESNTVVFATAIDH